MKNRPHFFRLGFLSAVTALLCACGGGGGGSSVTPVQSGNSSSATGLTGFATILIPKRVTSSVRTNRKPKYVSPSTMSVTFQSQAGVASVFTATPVTPTSPGCSAGPSGTQCTVPFAILPGSNNVTVTLYDNANPNLGNPLATTTQTVTAAGGASNSFTFTLNGIPAMLSGSVAFSSAGTLPVTVSGIDFDNNAINSGFFDSIVTTQVDDTTGGLSFPNGIPGTGNFNVTYNGNPNTASSYVLGCSTQITGGNINFCGTISAYPSNLLITVHVPSNTVYAAGGNVFAFSPTQNGNVTPIRTIAYGSNGVAVSANGTTYSVQSNQIVVYAAGAGNTSPNTINNLTTYIFGPNTQLGSALAIAVDSSGNMYAANSTSNSITVYGAGASGNSSPIRTISGAATGLNGPNGLAFDSAGNLYVSNAGLPGITVYAAGANGNAAPLRTATGGSFSGIAGLAIDNVANKIYTATSNNNAVNIYPTSASGTVAPAASISGASTSLNNARAVAIDGNENIYVGNANSHVITVYAAGSTGNVAPTRTLSAAAMTSINGIGIRP